MWHCGCTLGTAFIDLISSKRERLYENAVQFVNVWGAFSLQIFTEGLLCSGDLESIQLAGQALTTISKSSSKSETSLYQVVIESMCYRFFIKIGGVHFKRFIFLVVILANPHRDSLTLYRTRPLSKL